VDALESPFEVYYANEEGKYTEKERSTMTVEEVLFQCLACVACYSGTFCDGDNTPSKKAIGNAAGAKDSESKMMFVGTFRDQVNKEKFEERDNLLRKKIENTPFYEKGIIEFASEDQLMLAVDNMNGGQAEIDEIRDILVKVIKKSFKEIEIPTSWLVLSLQIRRKNLRTMSLEACEELAMEVRIDPAELQEALWFLHHHVGVLLYYPDLPALKTTVISDIQVVFDSASNLIKNTFTFEHVNRAESKKFQDTAQFSLKNIKEAVSKNTDNLIPLKSLVELLQYLGILTVVPPDPSSGENAEEPTYFMPCVLKSARASELETPCSDPAPLLVCYDCGYMPIGVFPSLITNLVSQQQSLGWRLQKGKQGVIYKNKVEFLVGDNYDTVTLISRPRYFEIVLSRSEGSLCSHVRTVIQSTLTTTNTHTNYHFSMPYKFGFECPIHPGREHLCIYEKKSAKKMLCHEDPDRVQLVDLESRHKVWFCLSPSDRKLVPDLEFLTLFKWRDAHGAEQELRIVSTVSAKWRELGLLVGLISSELEGFDRKSLHHNFDCCVHVFTHWFNNGGHPPKYPLSWKGLFDLLCDIKYRTIANDLEAALASRGVNIE
jgi:ankyrin